MIEQIVDAHHHLWNLNRIHYPWLMERGVVRFFGDPTPIQRDYLVGDFLDDIGDLPVTNSVHIQVGADSSDSIAETRWLQSEAQSTPLGIPNAIVAFCDLADENTEEILDAQAESGNLRGIRQIVGRSPDEDAKSGSGALLDSSIWIQNLARLPSRQLSFDLQLIPAQLPAVTNVLAKIPDLRVALCHCGSPHDQSEDGLAFWRRELARIAELPNVYCKLSGFSMFEQNWDAERVRKTALAAIDIFGVDRCMFGSNFPVEKLYVTYNNLYSTYLDIAAEFSESEQQNLLADTARRFYRISD
jgi:predicted TIM-barrel fold metal-dependent hydrolase